MPLNELNWKDILHMGELKPGEYENCMIKVS